MTFACRHHFSAALAIAVLAFAAAPSLAQTASAGDPRGRWITASGNLEVEVAPCGTALCGIVTKVLNNRSMSREGSQMKPVDDASVLGLAVLRNFTPAAGGEPAGPPAEWTGEIYNRENGNTYRSTLRVSTAARPEGELLVHAYIGLPLFGKTQHWQRADGAAR